MKPKFYTIRTKSEPTKYFRLVNGVYPALIADTTLSIRLSGSKIEDFLTLEACKEAFPDEEFETVLTED